jgi:uncharacterized OsmC-like protein
MTAQHASMPQPTMRNGVNVTALGETISAVQNNAGLADFQFRASNRWIAGGKNRSTIQGYRACGEENTSRASAFSYYADEPQVLLGDDTAANPVEFVLHALAACLTTTLVYHAAARGIEIRRLESSLEGDLDLRGFLGLSEDVRKGYQAVRVQMRVDADAQPEALRELAVFSPVYDIVSKSLPVEVSVERF